jgi:hypothetical protein
MITLKEDNGAWVAECPFCAWKMSQAKHTKTRHVCKSTGETYTYVPPDWESRPHEDRNNVYSKKPPASSLPVQEETAPPPKAPRRIPPKRTRGSAKVAALGLGDRVESALQIAGITKDRWAAFKATMGLPATCNCDARKQYLNKLGEELGESARKAVASLFGG